MLFVTEIFSSKLWGYSFKYLQSFLIYYQVYPSPHVKRSGITGNKDGIYKLPHELSNNLRLRILGD